MKHTREMPPGTILVNGAQYIVTNLISLEASAIVAQAKLISNQKRPSGAEALLAQIARLSLN